MGSLGCPECSRTPVIFSVSQKMWFCKSCKHTWREEDGKPEPVYWVAEKLPEKKRLPATKSARTAASRKVAKAKKPAGKPAKKSKK